MSRQRCALIAIFFATFVLSTSCLSAKAGVKDPAGPPHEEKRLFETEYLSIQLLPGWKAEFMGPPEPVFGKTTVAFIQGRYIFSINPVFQHASGGIGGRFDQVAWGMPSVRAVMARVDHPAGGFECGQSHSRKVTDSLTMTDVFTRKSAAPPYEGMCDLPSDGDPRWFTSYDSGAVPGGHGSEYAIAVGYDSDNVDLLPSKDSPELTRMLDEVSAMLKTLIFKPPISISHISPQSGPPGTMITVYGKGLNLGKL
jgi:hypothetical protein